MCDVCVYMLGYVLSRERKHAYLMSQDREKDKKMQNTPHKIYDHDI